MTVKLESTSRHAVAGFRCLSLHPNFISTISSDETRSIRGTIAIDDYSSCHRKIVSILTV